MKRQALCILGSTGSIGVNTLDVAARHPERFEVFALSAKSSVQAMLAQCVQYKPAFAAMSNPAQAKELRHQLQGYPDVRTEVLEGPLALETLAAHPEVDIVMAAVVGAAGLPACMSAARHGKRLLLANKEALVVGGGLFMSAVAHGGATLLPIDSEHSAIFQCLPQDPTIWPDHIAHIILTASGGPFLTLPIPDLKRVTPEQACAHPTWTMGRKISVDSATMMNKALEVIEAHWLFQLQPEQIKVVIHPQSIIHSMVVCPDNSVLAQLGSPDMRSPIAYGLAYPERIACGAPALDFSSLCALHFEALDPLRYPGLSLAWECLRGPPGTTAVLNAANEEAVAAFLGGLIRFDQIHTVNLEVLEKTVVSSTDSLSIDALLDLDQRVRATAAATLRRGCA